MSRYLFFRTKKIMEIVKFCNSFLVCNNAQIVISVLKEIIKLGISIPYVILLDLNMPVMDG
jgi:ABC-type methionine transport system permease subunit